MSMTLIERVGDNTFSLETSLKILKDSIDRLFDSHPILDVRLVNHLRIRHRKITELLFDIQVGHMEGNELT